jgi:hypothetical protein
MFQLQFALSHSDLAACLAVATVLRPIALSVAYLQPLPIRTAACLAVAAVPPSTALQSQPVRVALHSHGQACLLLRRCMFGVCGTQARNEIEALHDGGGTLLLPSCWDGTKHRMHLKE